MVLDRADAPRSLGTHSRDPADQAVRRRGAERQRVDAGEARNGDPAERLDARDTLAPVRAASVAALAAGRRDHLTRELQRYVAVDRARHDADDGLDLAAARHWSRARREVRIPDAERVDGDRQPYVH